jgi:hypothetical protein
MNISMTQKNSPIDGFHKFQPFHSYVCLLQVAVQNINCLSQSPRIQILLDHEISSKDNIYLEGV